ncbi:hypothetical protein D9M70_526370 [compost metagenome]
MFAAAVESQFEAVVHQAFMVHARADVGFAQQVDHALFQHPGANAAEDVVRALAFDDDVVDSSLVQQLAEEKAGRAGADDGDLSLHCCCPLEEFRWRVPGSPDSPGVVLAPVFFVDSHCV